MNVKKFEISGPLLLSLKTFSDTRGFFVERFKAEYAEALGITNSFIQDNFSRSFKNVVRGLHMQHSPGQGKLVTCLAGSILDVAVDVRAKSPTFGKYVQVNLKGDEPSLFWIPPGFAHGFSVLSETADVHYKVDCLYNSKNEIGLQWNDPELAVDWKVSQPIVSEKDTTGIRFSEYKLKPVF